MSCLPGVIHAVESTVGAVHLDITVHATTAKYSLHATVFRVRIDVQSTFCNEVITPTAQLMGDTYWTMLVGCVLILYI